MWNVSNFFYTFKVNNLQSAQAIISFYWSSIQLCCFHSWGPAQQVYCFVFYIIFVWITEPYISFYSSNFEYYSDFNSTWDGEEDEGSNEVSKGEVQSVRKCHFSQKYHHHRHHHCHYHQHHHHHNHCRQICCHYCRCTKSTRRSLIFLR